MLCLSLVKRYLITTLVRYNPPFPDNTTLHSTSGLTSGFYEASLVSGVFKDGVQCGGKPFSSPEPVVSGSRGLSLQVKPSGSVDENGENGWKA